MSDDRSTDADLARLRASHAALPAGPYAVVPRPLEFRVDAAADGPTLAEFPSDLDAAVALAGAEFFAFAHNIFPALLDRLAAAEYERDAARREIAHLSADLACHVGPD